MIENQKLIKIIRAQFKLYWHGIHGVNHMARVRQNGLRLAEATGAKTNVIELFAFLHDSKRLNDGADPEHGKRAAEFAGDLRARGVIEVSDSDFDLLKTACALHSKGLTEADATVQACWDADRLDRGRLGDRPDPSYLCTDAAKGMLEWAYDRSCRLMFDAENPPLTFYHGTSSNNLKAILKEGLFPAKASGLNERAPKIGSPQELKSAASAVCITPYEDLASYCAAMATFGKWRGGDGIVLKIEVPDKSRVKFFSVIEWQVEGSIPPEWIVAWKRINLEKLAQAKCLAHHAEFRTLLEIVAFRNSLLRLSGVDPDEWSPQLTHATFQSKKRA
jgi:uncharacterized protein